MIGSTDNVLASFLGFGKFDPVLIAPEQDDRVTACLRGLAAHSKAEELMTAPVLAGSSQDAMQDDYWPAQGDWRAAYRPYMVKAGILHVPVKGVLLHDFTYSIGSYATGYYYIQKCIERGVADPEVQGIALVCDSPGGHVAGCFELVDRIYDARSKKPIHAFAHESAYSAAYAIASAASKLTVSKTGGVGSIGVVTAHVDYSEAMKTAGIKVTLIHAGKHKVDGNPYQSLPADVKERIQGRIDQAYGIFCASVARNRSMKESAVRGTEALTYTATEAVGIGLADKIGPLDTALADFAAFLCGESGDEDMAEKNDAATELAAQEQAKAQAAAVAQAATAAASAERKRIADIKGCDAAKERPQAADALAMTTDLSVEAASALLAKMPTEAKPAAVTPAATNAGSTGFDAVMATEAPKAGAGDGATDVVDEDAKAKATAKRILSAHFGGAPAKA